jgi:IPT/TIG domain/FG-GAP repeat
VPGSGQSLRAATDGSLTLPRARSAAPSARWRTLVAALLVCLALAIGLSVGLNGGHTSPAPRALAHASSLLPTGALAPVSDALGASERLYAIGSSGGVLSAQNPAQGLEMAFRRGIVHFGAPGIELGLGLQAAGYGSSLHALGEATPLARRNRVLYAHAGVSESYVNGPLGVEQYFTLPRALPGNPTGALTLAMTVSGQTRPHVEEGGQSIRLRGGDGHALRYGSLAVTDAGGQHLPSWLALDGRTILLRVDARGARYPLRIDPLIQQSSTLTDEPVNEGARFGFSVALSADGNTALIGARVGVGEAWVFTRAGSTWEQQGPPLEIPEAGSDGQPCGEGADCASRGVALSADGNTALVGAPGGRGDAWVFTRSGSTWSQQGANPLKGGEEESGPGHFGRSVALSGDGDTALVGAPADDARRGSVWVYTRSGSTWSQQGAKLTGAGEAGEGRFGRSVTLSGGSETELTAVVGAPDDASGRGAVWVLTRSGSTWSPQGAKLTAGAEEIGEGNFGASVALSVLGNTALVGAPEDQEGAGAAWVFTRAGSTWSQQGAKLTGGGEATPPSEFGASVALAADGEVALVGAPRDRKGVGAAWLFTRSGSAWTRARATIAIVEAEERERFGTSVALSSSGGTALIGGPAADSHSGLAWTFANSSAPPPAVSSISPPSGSTSGGNLVTVKGTGFLPGATVEIGGAASSVDVLSETELTAVTPGHKAGPEEVVVSDEAGGSTAGPVYTYEVTASPPIGTTSGSNVGNGGSSGNGAGVGVLGSTVTVVPPPQLGVTGNLAPVSGKVFIELPATNAFVLLSGITEVPFGTIVNAIHGKVTVTTVGPNGRLQTITFYSGEFELTQNPHGRVLATLVGGNFSVCPTRRERSHLAQVSSTHTSGKHTVRKLWADGHGSYSTKGNYASGAVLGTRWLTEDRCDGTLFFVATDRVAVRNLVNHHHLTVRAGHSYLAKAP